MHQDRELLMLSLNRFFEDKKHVTPVINIIKGTSDVSLRLIDWFITNYAKKANVVVSRNDEKLNVYHSYRTQLRTFSKQQFDPFRRHERIRFVYGEDDDEYVDTTVGQLNFFRWAVETGILEYIESNKSAIEANMVSGESRPMKSSSSITSHVHERCKTTITFD